MAIVRKDLESDSMMHGDEECFSPRTIMKEEV